MVTVASVALQVISLIQLLPEAAEAVTAWFANNPNATPEETAAMLSQYNAAVAERRKSVAAFNEGL